MIYSTPRLSLEALRRLDKLDELRRHLGAETRRPVRWMGSLRRFARARAVESSTSIEGFAVPMREAVALVNRDQAPDPGVVAEQAVACYAQAMDHVTAMADDPEFEWSKRVLLDLHFEVCYFQTDRAPGRWRTRGIVVTDPEGRIAYRGPDAETVPGLMAEVVDWLESCDTDAHPVVRAAMAHLNVVSVHPFRDGNGRVSRIVQSLVLSRQGLLAPEFASIEEWLGEHTQEYYQALQRIQGSSYSPTGDPSAWVSFCLDAHMAQAERRLREVEQAARRWEGLETLVAERGWPERLTIALERALTGYLDRSGYVAEASISVPTGNLDLRRLLDTGLILKMGQGRVTRYRASDRLREAVGLDREYDPE